jgi:hypothetical protein
MAWRAKATTNSPLLRAVQAHMCTSVVLQVCTIAAHSVPQNGRESAQST